LESQIILESLSSCKLKDLNNITKLDKGFYLAFQSFNVISVFINFTNFNKVDTLD
jgi:hypothetical protein